MDAAIDAAMDLRGGSCSPISSDGGVLGVPVFPFPDLIKDVLYVPPAAGAAGVVAITDVAMACSLAQNAAIRAGSRALVFTFPGGAPAVGTIAVGKTTVDVESRSYDSACGASSGAATAGSVIITESDACGVRGTYDITLFGGRVYGFFAAPTCITTTTDASSSCQ